MQLDLPYEKPVVEIVDAEQLIESVGAKAATSVTGGSTLPPIN
jgi:hypothetical protein